MIKKEDIISIKIVKLKVLNIIALKVSLPVVYCLFFHQKNSEYHKIGIDHMIHRVLRKDVEA